MSFDTSADGSTVHNFQFPGATPYRHGGRGTHTNPTRLMTASTARGRIVTGYHGRLQRGGNATVTFAVSLSP